MKKWLVLTTLILAASLAYAGLASLFEVGAFIANENSIRGALLPQTETPRPIRTIPNLEEIHIWLAGREFSFDPNHSALTTRLNVLDNSSFDMKPPSAPGGLDTYDIFYSNADGRINISGAYLTIEAVSNSQAQGLGGGNVAEIGLRRAGLEKFDYGNEIASFVALGSNADPDSINRAIDAETRTFTRLGNTVGQSQRLRITIGFFLSSGDPTQPTLNTPIISLIEGDAGTTDAVFTLTLNTSSSLPVSVNVATAADILGTDRATAGIDYVSTSGRVTIPPGELSAQFRVPIIGDRVAEGTKFFLINVTGYEKIGSDGFSLCTIFDNDRAVRERCSGELSLPVTNERPLTVTMSLAENILVQKLTVGLFIETDNVEDIRIQLKSPTGVTGKLIRAYPKTGVSNIGVGCSPSQLCILDEDAGLRFLPADAPFVGHFDPRIAVHETPLSRFNGENARGEWTLIVENARSSTRAILKCWCLGFEGSLTGCGLQPNGLDFRTFTYITPTASVISNGAPVPGANVTFSIFDLGHPPSLRETLGPFQTDQNGQAKMTPYTNSFDAPFSSESHQLIQAEVTINGVPCVARAQINWIETACPMVNLELEQNASNAEVTLAAARGFRDNVLSQTSRGRRYTEQYYEFSSDAVQVLMFNPMLALRSREIIERYKPALQSMVNGEQVTLTRGDLVEIDSFLNSFAAKGSPQLQQAVKEVREDLKNPNVHDEFHITVIEGPKREIPAHHLIQTTRQAGGAALFVGLFMAFAYCFIGPGKEE